jgi:dynein heavy chain
MCRCGMVYCDPEELKWLPYVETWLATTMAKLPEPVKEQLLDLFRRYVENGLKFVVKKCSQPIVQVCDSK